MNYRISEVCLLVLVETYLYMSLRHIHKYKLFSPIFRKAKFKDIYDIVNLIVNTDNYLVNSIFGGNQSLAMEILMKQYHKSTEGIFILTEKDKLVGVTKLQFPDIPNNNKTNIYDLIKSMGFFKGIKCGFKLSQLDEIKLKGNEGFIEYLYVDIEWRLFNAEELLFESIIQEALRHNVDYITTKIESVNYKSLKIFKNAGFKSSRNKFFNPQIIFKRNKNCVMRYHIHNSDIFENSKLHLSQKIEHMKEIWLEKKREIISAIKISLLLSSIPLVAGVLAFMRGYQLAVIFWIFILSSQFLGIRLYLSGYVMGRISLTTAMMLEGSNLIMRLLNSESWFDRIWLLPIGLLVFWLMYVFMKNPYYNHDFIYEKNSLNVKNIRN